MSQKRDNVDYLNKKYHQALLFDFYGELLNENNREIYEDYILNDLSLGEIAMDRGVSRQGIHDAIKRTDRRLEEFENKIHLLERYSIIQDKVEEIHKILTEIQNTGDVDKINKDRLIKIEGILKDISNET